MDLNDHASSVPAKPAASATVAPGYCAKPADPNDDTVLQADCVNGVLEEMKNAINDGGLALDKADDTQLREAIKAKVISAAADTGSVSNAHLRTVMASTASRAQGADSSVIASNASIASGANSAVIASHTVTASGAESMAAASTNGLASGATSLVAASTGCRAIAARGAVVSSYQSYANGSVETVIIGGQNCECVESRCLAMGYSAVDLLAPTGANNNLTILIKAIDGTILATGKATINGGLEVPEGTNEVADIDIQAMTVAAGARVYSTAIANSKIDAGSIVLWSFDCATVGAERLSMGRCYSYPGNVQFEIVNSGAADWAGGNITFRYFVINPA